MNEAEEKVREKGALLGGLVALLSKQTEEPVKFEGKFIVYGMADRQQTERQNLRPILKYSGYLSISSEQREKVTLYKMGSQDNNFAFFFETSEKFKMETLDPQTGAVSQPFISVSIPWFYGISEARIYTK